MHFKKKLINSTSQALHANRLKCLFNTEVYLNHSETGQSHLGHVLKLLDLSHLHFTESSTFFFVV